MINAENIFFEEFKTTHNVVPFDRLDKSYYEEAVDSGIRLAQQEIDAIANQRSKPTFDNTIVALDNAVLPCPHDVAVELVGGLNILKRHVAGLLCVAA